MLKSSLGELQTLCSAFGIHTREAWCGLPRVLRANSALFRGRGERQGVWFGVFVTWFFAPLSSEDSDGVNGRLGRWWCIRKLPKNARHCEIPILEPTVKSNVGSWGVGSRHLQVQHDELSFLLALQVCVAPSVVAY